MLKNKSDHIKYNALKNGIYIPIGEFMPCLRHCPFKDICDIYNSIYSKYDINYAGSCPIECALYLNLSEHFNTNPVYLSVDKALINEYISLFIAIERLMKQVSLNPELVTENNKLTKPYEVLSRLQKKFLRTSEEILNIINKGGFPDDGKDKSNDY